MDVNKIQEIISLYEIHKNTHKVAELCGLSRPTVTKVLKENNIRINAKSCKTQEEKQEIVNAYVIDKMNTSEIKEKFHIGKPKIKEILKEFGYSFRTERRNARKHVTEFYEKYPSLEGTNKVYIVNAIDNSISYRTQTINTSGEISKYCKEHFGIEVPSTYQIREYFCKNNKHWWEEYFTVIEEESKGFMACPYCGKRFEMIDNWKSGFLLHINFSHTVSKKQFLIDYPNNKELFETKLEKFYDNKDNYVICKICGQKVGRIDNLHLKKHGITKEEYIQKFGNKELIAKNTLIKLRECARKRNEKNVDNEYFISQAEKEIFNFIKDKGIKCIKDRKTLKGQELDIYIPSRKIAIEYNGCYWHTEKFKPPYFHLNKTLNCEKEGIRLIQIFEDEYETHKNIVLSRLCNILNLNQELPKIQGRKCELKIVEKENVLEFINKNTIEGIIDADIYIASYYKNNLVGVLTFNKISDSIFRIVQQVTDILYYCQGVVGKMFKFFTTEFRPKKIEVILDKRWFIEKDNIYELIGFKVEKILPPKEKFYIPKINHHKRFDKEELIKYDNNKDLIVNSNRIWDCGYIKYAKEL